MSRSELTNPSAAYDSHVGAGWLAPLFEPRSIAILGASDKPGSFGRSTLEQLLAGGFRGRLYPVNPRISNVLGLTCYPTLADLPQPADLVIYAVPNAVLETEVALAAQLGCRSGVIFASGYVERDQSPPLTERLVSIARKASMPLCGANCMGFINPSTSTYATWYKTGSLRSGGLGLISHSGSIFLTLSANDARLAPSLAVSPGQELVITAADCMHHMLAQSQTRAIALVLETVRDPANFIAALELASARDIPVIALKIGRTAQSAQLAKSHSGAIAGNDAAYEALFDHHGVMRVRTVDELAATAMLMLEPRRAFPGGLGAVLDSGGARGMLIDLAADVGVPFAAIGEKSASRLRSVLDFGLEPVNPVDAWGTGNDPVAIIQACLETVADDPDTGLILLMSDISNDDDPGNADFAKMAQTVRDGTDKPVIVGLPWSQHRGKALTTALAATGLPVLDGVENVLLAVRNAFRRRDQRALPALQAPLFPATEVVVKWRRALKSDAVLDETGTLALLSDFGLLVPRHIAADNLDQVLAAGRSIGFPVVLKSAAPGLLHKSDVGGVQLGLGDEAELRAAYEDFANRLGPRAVVAETIARGVEMAIGLVNDDQFGPILMISAGGTLIEVLRDRAVALPPVDRLRAKRMVDRLSLSPLLAGHRGNPSADLEALADAIVAVSAIARDLGDQIAEMDINPIIVSASGAVAVDGLTFSRKGF